MWFTDMGQFKLLLCQEMFFEESKALFFVKEFLDSPDCDVK